MGKRVRNLEGFKKNNFTVVRETDKRGSGGSVLWECQCICGNLKYYKASFLTKEMPESCGCVPKYEDMTGVEFNEFTVIELSEERNKAGIRLWKCQCSCGEIRYYLTTHIKRKTVNSCGCLEQPDKESREKFPREHAVWESMKARCNNPKHPQYHHYGGRGIKVCDRWRHSFKNFITDMGGRPSDEYSIERVDNDKGYSPDNCIWADGLAQVLNRRLNKNNRSGYKGVNKAGNKWVASITVNYKYVHLGSHKTKEEAIKARKEAEVKYWGRELEY